MNLQDVLRAKGAAVHTIDSHASLDDVVQELVRRNCGSLVVVDGETEGQRRMVGIITERDILRSCAARIGHLHDVKVAERMTHDVVTGSPTQSVDECLDLMTDRRIRHLPILDGGQLVGLVSIGDVVKARHRQTEFENHCLKSYIQS